VVAAVFAALSAIAAPAPSLPSLIETIDLTAPVVSPDGRLVVFRQGAASIASNRYGTSWWVAPTEGKAPPRPIGDGGQALWTSSGTVVTEAPSWSADGAFVYYRALKDGQVQVWRSRVADGISQQVTRDEADVERFTLGGDGKLAYVVRATRARILDAEAADYDGGVRIDHTVDPAQSLFSAVEINGRMASQRLSGSWFQRDGRLGDAPERVRVIDTANLAQVEAAVEPPAGAPKVNIFEVEKAVGTAQVSRFGRLNVVWRPGGTRLEFVAPDGKVTVCGAPVCGTDRIAWAVWLRSGEQALVAVRDAHLSTQLLVWSPETGTLRTVARAPGLLDGGGYGLPCDVTNTAAICVFAGADTPPRLERIDLGTGERQTIALPNGGPTAHTGVEIMPLTWRGAAGRRFTGQLLAPIGAKAAPLFVQYYRCGGYLRGGVGDVFPMLPMAQAGVVVLCINESRDDSSGLDAVQDYDVGLEGVEAAIDLLAARGLVNRQKVGMGGLSFGSEVTLWTATHTNLLAAAAIASIQIGPVYYWMNGVAGRDVHDGLRRTWKLGAPDETPDRWRAISAVYNVGRISTPLLMQLPEQEYRPTIDLFAALTQSTTPTELYAFAQEPHILTQPRHRLAAYVRNIDWFRFWLQGYVDPDPEKAEQYMRWRAMAKAPPTTHP
jgi:dipeptidyl aminopeptidase/acylaminoacyl peptidase